MANLAGMAGTRYISEEKCDELMDETRQEISKINIDIAKISTKLNVIIGILSAIGTAFLGAVIRIFFGG